MLRKGGSSCTTSGNLRDTLAIYPVISHERGKDWEVLTTSGPYMVICGTYIPLRLIIEYNFHDSSLNVDNCQPRITHDSSLYCISQQLLTYTAHNVCIPLTKLSMCLFHLVPSLNSGKLHQC